MCRLAAAEAAKTHSPHRTVPVPRGPIRTITSVALWLWASPWTLLGLCVGIVGLATGGRVRRRGPVVEFHGGAVAGLLKVLPVGPIAMTLGHVILGRTEAGLDAARSHELVHVRQYERWGPLFVPAYLLCSLKLWLSGRDAYHDNPFEREAYQIAP